MINWDLPWNPNRLEQRMGRIHRYGQEYEVKVVNLVANTTREGSVLVRLMDKLERMRDQLGPRPGVRRRVERPRRRPGPIGHADPRGDPQPRSMEDILGDLEFVDSSVASVAAARGALGEALATSHIDMGSILGDERDSKERRLTPEFVERFFADGLRYLAVALRSGADEDWSLDFVPADIRREARRPRTLGSSGPAAG